LEPVTGTGAERGIDLNMSEPNVRRPRRYRSMIAVALGGLVLALAGCGGSGSATSTTGSSGPTTTVAAKAKSPSAGCGLPVSPGTVTLTPTIGGRPRVAIVHVPVGYRSTTAVPLVLNMHGSQSTALAQEALTGMDATADADQFIVVYPQGDIPAGTGFEWNVPNEPLFGGAPVPADAPNDVSFIEQLVTLLEHHYCINPERVYATGFSGGARMSSQLGCDASGVFAAVAPVSGLRLPTPCPSTRPVPVISFHGLDDPVDPYNGNGQKYWTYSVPVAAQRWAAHNDCSSKAAVSQPDPGVTLTTYPDCAGGSAVELYSIAGEGHEWPGGPHLPRAITKLLGPQTTAISANNTMWAFFLAHPLRTAVTTP
jgi:polyhydroxybutyrate depolymerase